MFPDPHDLFDFVSDDEKIKVEVLDSYGSSLRRPSGPMDVVFANGQFMFEGERAGHFSVLLTDSPVTVHFRVIILSHRFRDKDIASKWRSHFRQRFLSCGVERWTGYPSGPAGYAWATPHHVRFADNTSVSKIKTAISEYLESCTDKEIVRLGKALMKHDDLRPYMVAEWGRPDSYDKDTIWPGKEVLLNTPWKLEALAEEVSS